MNIVLTSHWNGTYVSGSGRHPTSPFARSYSFSGSSSRKYAWYSLHGLLPKRRTPSLSQGLPLRMEDSQRLPFELVLMIMELAADQCQATARSVMLVCRRSHGIALPYVYRTVTFSWGANLPGFLRFVSTKPHVLRYIQSLWVGNHFAPPALLAQCPNLHRLAIEPQSFINYCSSNRQENARHRLRHVPSADDDPDDYLPVLPAREIVLLCYPCDWSELKASHPFTVACLQQITHLWLTRSSQLFTRIRHRHILPCLSYLTHLVVKLDAARGQIVDREVAGSISRDLLENIPSLQMLVVAVDHAPKSGKEIGKIYDVATNLRKIDERIHVFPIPVGLVEFMAIEEEVLPLFKSASSGQSSIWDKARELRNTMDLAPNQSWKAETLETVQGRSQLRTLLRFWQTLVTLA